MTAQTASKCLSFKDKHICSSPAAAQIRVQMDSM